MYFFWLHAAKRPFCTVFGGIHIGVRPELDRDRVRSRIRVVLGAGVGVGAGVGA
jgi:hypothetical protein